MRGAVCTHLVSVYVPALNMPAQYVNPMCAWAGFVHMRSGHASEHKATSITSIDERDLFFSGP